MRTGNGPFLRKLATFVRLNDSDADAIDKALLDIRDLPDGATIIEQGEIPLGAHVVLDGWACRYKILAGGARQILDFLVAGDICDGRPLYLSRMDHSVCTLSRSRVAYIKRDEFLKVMNEHPRVARALWYASIAQESVAREWIANVGGRPGAERLAHLICELCYRLRAVGRGSERGFDLPITQSQLGDATGLSVVHVNRRLQELRQTRLITLSHRRVAIPDLGRLEDFAGFDPTYLQPNGEVPAA